MKLQKREIKTILAGVAVVAAFAIYQSIPAAGGTASGDSIGAMLTRIGDFDRLSKNLRTQADKLHVAIPAVGPAEQEAQVRESLAKIAQANGVQLSSIKRQERTSRLTSAQSAIDFQLDAGGNYESALKFVNALESDKTPFQVAELRIESGRAGGPGGGSGGPGGSGPRGGGPSGGGGQRNADGNVQLSLKVRSYLFARVIEEKKPAKPAATPAPSGPARAAATATPTPAPTSGPAQAKATPKPSPSPTATPAPEATVAAPKPASGPRRFTMKMGGQNMKITLDGRTATITLPDGTEQKKELTDEEYSKVQDGSFLDEIKKQGGEISEE